MKPSSPPSDALWTETVYSDLRSLAGSLVAGERPGGLDATALTHEVWLRLRQSRNASQLDRGAFLGVAAQAMRHTLLDLARQRAAVKRGGDQRRTTLDGRSTPPDPRDLALDLEEALLELEQIDGELSRIAELRFYGQASLAEIADALGCSLRTTKRRWSFARAWIQDRMREHSDG